MSEHATPQRDGDTRPQRDENPSQRDGNTAPQIIALVGEPGAGKDEFAAALVEAGGWTRVAFADPIREMLYELNPWILVTHDQDSLLTNGLRMTAIPAGEQHAVNGMLMPLRVIVDCLGWDAGKKITEVRECLQNLGETVRKRDPEFWTEESDGAVLGGLQAGAVVVTDVRHPNERSSLRTWEVALVRGRNPRVRLLRVRRPGHGRVNDHQSERHYDEIACDAELANDGTLEEWREKALAFAAGGTVVPN